MRFLIGLARAAVGFILLFAFLAGIPVATAFIVMIVIPPVAVVFWGADPSMLVLVAFGLAGFVATLLTIRGLARVQDWINESWWG